MTQPTGTVLPLKWGQGWADVTRLGYFGREYEGKNSDLDKAYDQLLRYCDSWQNRLLLIVSDSNQVVICTNYTNLLTRTYTLALDDLLKRESIEILRTVFFLGGLQLENLFTWEIVFRKISETEVFEKCTT